MIKSLKRHIPISLVAAALLMSFTACEKFLDVKPTNALLADNAISDAKTARAVVNAGYSKLKTYSINSALQLAVLPGDNVFFGGSQSQNIELDNHAFTVTNSAIVLAYSGSYSLINTVNWAIAEIPKVNDAGFETGEQDKLLGEAYFIRAFAYFNLVRSWGGVQLQLNPTTDLKTLGAIPRSTEAETYAHILADLQRAEELLPADNATTRNKIQQAVVRAFRAKVLLYNKQFEQAEVEANAVLALNKYRLVDAYSTFFQSPFLSTESIFELSASTNDTGTNGLIWFPASGTPRGSYENRPSNEIINLLNNPDIGGTRNSLLAARGTDVYVNLYHTVAPSVDPAYILRIADLYLIRAEARARKQNADVAGSIADLNKVRARSQATLFTATEAPLTSLVQAIWDERRLELAFEADRWYDLVRTEQAEKVLGVSRNFWLFPIPQADVLSDPYLNGNNPGY